jgi:hypothetical protein
MKPAPRNAVREPQGLEKLAGFQLDPRATAVSLQLASLVGLLGEIDPASVAAILAASTFGWVR